MIETRQKTRASWPKLESAFRRQTRAVDVLIVAGSSLVNTHEARDTLRPKIAPLDSEPQSGSPLGRRPFNMVVETDFIASDGFCRIQWDEHHGDSSTLEITVEGDSDSAEHRTLTITGSSEISQFFALIDQIRGKAMSDIPATP
jgi:hypothetical protein